MARSLASVTRQVAHLFAQAQGRRPTEREVARLHAQMQTLEGMERLSPPTVRLVAWHEAGHAVASHILGVPYARLTIEPWEHTRGIVEDEDLIDAVLAVPKTERERETWLKARIERNAAVPLEARAIVSLAGPVVEARVRRCRLRELFGLSGLQDWESCCYWVDRLIDAPEIRPAHRRALVARTRRLMYSPDVWRAIGALVTALLAHQVIAFAQAADIVNAARALEPAATRGKRKK